MKKAIMLIVFSVLIGKIHAQKEITRNLGDFNELKVFDKIQVTLVKSEENRIEITGIKRRDVNVVQNGNLLKIRMSLNNLWDGNNTKVTLFYKELKKLDVNEGARIASDDVITSRKLDIRAQEGGKIDAKIETDFLYAKSVTGGVLELEGDAKEQEVVINSGGQFYGRNLETVETQVRVSAGGIAEVNANIYLKANTNAGGTIRVFGNPKELDTQKLLGGKIIEVN